MFASTGWRNEHNVEVGEDNVVTGARPYATFEGSTDASDGGPQSMHVRGDFIFGVGEE